LSRYLASRLFQGILALWVVTTLTFACLRMLPGGPFDQEKTLPPEVLRNIEARYQLDRPLLAQYGLYLWGVVQGDLGPSYKYLSRDVSDILRDALPVSLQLGSAAIVLTFVFGVGIGLLSGTRRGSPTDQVTGILAVLGMSVPSFVLGALLIRVVSLGLGWLPAGLWEGLAHVVLPAVTLAALPAAYVARLTRSSVLEVVDRDFVRTARSKGLSELRIHLHHVLRNALLAVVTYFGPLLAMLLTGSFVVEQVFSIPGMGRFFVTAVHNRDYPLVLGVTLVYAAFVVIANLLVDLLYGWLDPRIRLGGREE
jgi:oligopeptide transport system permease protein